MGTYTNLFRSPYSHVKKKKKVAKLKWYFFIKILKRKSPLQMREYGRTRILVFNGLLTFWSLPAVKSSHWLAELCYQLVEPFWDLSVLCPLIFKERSQSSPIWPHTCF